MITLKHLQRETMSKLKSYLKRVIQVRILKIFIDVQFLYNFKLHNYSNIMKQSLYFTKFVVAYRRCLLTIVVVVVI